MTVRDLISKSVAAVSRNSPAVSTSTSSRRSMCAMNWSVIWAMEMTEISSSARLIRCSRRSSGPLKTSSRTV